MTTETAKKEKQLDSHKQEQGRKVYLLSKHFPVDEEKKIVHIQLKYPTASELLDLDMSTKENPFFKTDIQQRISDILTTLPMGYHATIELLVRDYEGYEPKAIMEAFNDSLELSHYDYQKENKKKRLSVALMVLMGLALLLVKSVGTLDSWFGAVDSVKSDLISEIFDICGTVFIWEATSVIFLSPSEVSIQAKRFQFKVLSVAFLNTKGAVIAFENREQLYEKWDTTTITYRYGSKAILIASTALLGFSFYYILSIFETAIKGPYVDGAEKSNLIIFIFEIVAFFLLAFIYFLGGFSGIRYYMGHGTVFAGIVSIFLGLSVVLNLVYSIRNQDVTSLVRASFSIPFDILFVTGYFCMLFGQKKKKINPKEIPSELKSAIQSEIRETKELSSDILNLK